MNIQFFSLGGKLGDLPWLSSHYIRRKLFGSQDVVPISFGAIVEHVEIAGQVLRWSLNASEL
jgi:hypothetical protein